MSELHILDVSSSDEVKKRIDEYAKRCGAIITIVFKKPPEVKRQFKRWFNDLVSQSENPVLLLHEEPLYLVAEYLGFDIRYIDESEIAAEYERLARSMNW